VRVPADSLDRLLEATADLGAWHAQLRAALPPPARRHTAPHHDALDGAQRRVADLRAEVLGLRLVPLSTLQLRYERLVRDLGRATGKQVGLDTRGFDVAVDKQVVDHLAEPLLHIVRNAVDHGIEPPRERIRAGKPEVGTVSMRAHARGGVLTLVVADDGRGVDAARLAEAAARRGTDTTGWPRERVLELVFAAEVSTADRVTTLSGRGVGLDQARRALERIGGSIALDATVGAGTAFRIRVPLVIAVQRSLLVGCADVTVAIPFTAVVEALQLPRAAVGGGGLPWRDRTLPIRSLAVELGLDGAGAGPHASFVIVEVETGPVAFQVDRLAGHQDLMIQELDPVFGRPRGITGAAALPDGRTVAVVDPVGLGAPS
jgi:two-component system chemotaxis sensor kinase CheA